MTNNMDYIYNLPPLQLTITTYELMGNKYDAVVSHTFHGNTQQELFDLIECHKMIDPFFAASFKGMFHYQRGIIYLRNSEMKVLYP